MSGTSRVVAGIVVGGALLAGSLAAAGPAAADPGFCGERFDTALNAGESVYVVKNRCDRPWNFRVWLPSQRRYARAGSESGGCQVVQPGGFAYFADPWPDNNWTVQNC